jgi:NADH dehydrogenase/NADH:ubiquinone oxidoreductase subunit G
MKTRSPLFCLMLATVTSAPILFAYGADPAAKEEVMASDVKQSYQGEGRHFEITGNNDEITISGECSKVEVVGHDNKISLVAVGVIQVMGQNNLITYHRGLSSPKPKVETTGENNKVVSAE